MRELWGNVPFRVYFFMQFILALGGQFLPVALSWTILHQYRNAELNGLVLSLLVFPRLILLPVANVILRWFSPRQQIVGLFASLALITSAWAVGQYLFPQAPVWMLIAGTLLIGAIGALSLPMSYSVLPIVAGTGQLERANAVYQVGIQASTALGPLLSGAILLLASLAQVLGIFAMLLVAATLWGYVQIRVEPEIASTPVAFTLWTRSVVPVLWMVCASAFINLFLYGPLQVGMSTWIDLHHWPVTLLGVVLAAFGAGGALGASLQGIFLGLRSPFVTWSPTVILALSWLVLYPVLDVAWALPLVIFVAGIMTGWVTTIMLRAIYRLIPSSALTSVFSVIFLGSALGQVVSLDSTGVVLSHTGIPQLMAGAGGGLLCVGIAAFVLGVRMDQRELKRKFQDGVPGRAQ